VYGSVDCRAFQALDDAYLIWRICGLQQELLVDVVDMHVSGVGDGEGEEGEVEGEDVGPEGRKVEAVEMVHFVW
jgi:hypothetical protein